MSGIDYRPTSAMLCKCWAAILTMVCSYSMAMGPAAALAEDPLPTWLKLRATYSADLEALAKWCDERQLAEQAATTRAAIPKPDPRRLIVTIPPVQMQPAPPDASDTSDAAEWHRQFVKLRTAQADQVFEAARNAIAQDFASLAYEMIFDTLRENPDHERARKLLGYKLYNQEWHTLYEMDKLKKGFVWHPNFGWIKAADLPRLEAGERYYQPERKWISQEADAAKHPDIEHGWEIETEHYRIVTDHSLEAGVQLAARLEMMHLVWRQVFARFIATDAELAKLFQGQQGGRAKTSRRLQIVYFKNRQEYEQALKAYLPANVATMGIYLQDHAKAYFFLDDSGKDYSTLFHEATHQLFHETRPVSRQVGMRFNFWIIEGIACYMESLVAEQGSALLGGEDAVRYKDARYRLLNDNFYVPLAELCSMGMDSVRQDRRIATLYSQSGGLTHFLMHYDGGRYRDALVAYLVLVYAVKDQPDTLAQLTGSGFDLLDRQYKEFMQAEESEPPTDTAVSNPMVEEPTAANP